MVYLPTVLTALALSLAVTASSAHNKFNKRQVEERQNEAAKRWQTRSSTSAAGNGVKNITFTNPKASEFYIDGKSLPLVNFDVGPSWAGLLPISGKSDETRQLFFWFFPPGPEGSLDDLIFWTNGGPGCSSLEGMLQENGPFSWTQGQAKPTVNEQSWTNLSSVLWVEQPVGTGFSQGTPNITNEDELAAQLVGFMQQFLEVFSELKGKKLYLSGESYAGMYIPYIANYIYENPKLLDLSLQGTWMNDGYLYDDVAQFEITAVDYVKENANIFSLNQTYMNYLEQKNIECNYTGYVDKYATYPPQGPLPLPGGSVEFADGCDLWTDIYNNTIIVNPAFNVYRIWDTTVIWDILGYPEGREVYFNRRDVKKVIHAPLDVQWTECNDVAFPDDMSLSPVRSVLPNVIEKNQRTVIVNGVADFLIMYTGTRVVLQNMTWNGLQGFRTPIKNDSFIVDGVGAFGRMHSERGLTYYEVALSGHMVPQFAPNAAFQIMQYLMGFRDTP